MIIPPALADSTIRVATLLAAGSSLTGVASTSVTTLTEGLLKAMLLAKLRYAVMAVATLAVVSTGVGVVAQDSAPGAGATDRLKAVEQKLDRLLEVLGGSQAPHYSNYSSRDAVTTSRPATFSSADTVTANYAQPAATAATAVFGRGTSSSSTTGSSVAVSADGDIASRVDRLERRLGELERKLGVIERRVESGGPQRVGGSFTPGGRTGVSNSFIAPAADRRSPDRDPLDDPASPARAGSAGASPDARPSAVPATSSSSSTSSGPSADLAPIAVEGDAPVPSPD
jgi:hypothetical protein